jgi:SAM-dependent methyltransferase
MWGHNFAASTRMNPWREFRLGLTKEWALIRKHVPQGGTLLDAGCGFGEWVSFLNSRGYRAEGLDYSEDLVRRLRASYPQLTWTSGDIRHMPYPDAAFDAVISWGVIEHDEAGPLGALREFDRVLAPGGITIVTVPTDSRENRRAAEHQFPRTLPGHTFFQYFMSEGELAATVGDAGLEVVESGILPSASLHLLAPGLATRLNGLPFRLVDTVVHGSLSWLSRYCVMRYCVASKPRA